MKKYPPKFLTEDEEIKFQSESESESESTEYIDWAQVKKSGITKP